MKLPILLAKGIGRRVYDALGLEKMGDKFQALTINYTFLMVFFTLEMVFVNTLILRVSGRGIYGVLLYRVFSYAFSAVVMNVVSVFSRKINPIMAIRVSCGLYVLLFSVLFIGMERLASFIYFFGALTGMASGLNFSGHVVLLTNYTTQQNRSVGVAVITVIQGVMALFIPLVFGMVIGFLPGMSGYRVMFGVAMGVVLAQVSFVRKLTPVHTTQEKGEFKLALGLISRQLILRVMLVAEFARGMRDGVFAFFLNIVLFQIVNSEILVGFNTFLAGSASISAAWLYGKIGTPRNRAPLVGICVSILIVFCSILLFSLSPLTILMFSIINSFLAQMISNSTMNNSYDILGSDDERRSVMAGLLGFREIFLMSGRICGVVVVSLFAAAAEGYVYAMLTLTAIQYIVAVLLYIAIKL